MAESRLETMQLFTRVAETGSFSKAARALDIGQPQVSKRIAALEARLGTALIHRTSRSLKLTEAGQRFYAASVRVLQDVDRVEGEARKSQSVVSGEVKVASSSAIGPSFIVPRLPQLFASHPGLSVDIEASQEQVNLVAGGFDVAIRIGPLGDSSLVARRIGSTRLALVASPGYLARAGTPRRPEELASHEAVQLVSNGRPRLWDFKVGQGTKTVTPTVRFRSNDAEHLRAAVRAGIGIAYNARWLYTEDLANGSLVELLTAWRPKPVPIHAVFPGRSVPKKVKVFVDFVAAVFDAHPDLSGR